MLRFQSCQSKSQLHSGFENLVGLKFRVKDSFGLTSASFYAACHASGSDWQGDYEALIPT